MKSFWILLFLMAIILAVNFIFLPLIWFLAVLGICLVIGSVIFWINLKLVRSDLGAKLGHNQLNDIIKDLKEGLIVYDQNFRVQIFNKSAERIFKISAEEVIGRQLEPAIAQNQKYKLLAQTVFLSLAPVVRRLSEADAWPQLVDVSSDDLELRVSTGRINDSSGRLLGFFKIVQDRTRERELLHSKSRFISLAAHQLRTPLTAIKWAFETLIKEPSLKSEQKSLVEEAYLNAQRLLKIVNSLLDISKIEEGKFGYQFENIDLVDLVGEILISMELPAKSYGVKIYFDHPAGKKIIVKIDGAKLGMVLTSLLDNAIKYNTENGEVTVKIERLLDKPFIQVSVKDTGIGIPAEEIGNLFTKFYRGSNTAKLQSEGSGLGLYIAKNIIQRHGGEIWAESILGRGSTFYFTLPTDPNLIPPREIFYEEEE